MVEEPYDEGHNLTDKELDELASLIETQEKFENFNTRESMRRDELERKSNRFDLAEACIRAKVYGNEIYDCLS